MGPTTTEGSFDIPSDVPPLSPEGKTQVESTDKLLKSNEFSLPDQEISKDLEIKMNTEVLSDNDEKPESVKSVNRKNQIDEIQKELKETQLADTEFDISKHSKITLESITNLKENDKPFNTDSSETENTRKFEEES